MLATYLKLRKCLEWHRKILPMREMVKSDRGIVKNERQELLDRDVGSYNIDVCHFQENKIKERLDIIVKQHNIISLKIDRNFREMFFIKIKWKNNTHRHSPNNHKMHIN